MCLESLIILPTVLTFFPIIKTNYSLVILGFSFIDLIIFAKSFREIFEVHFEVHFEVQFELQILLGFSCRTQINKH